MGEYAQDELGAEESDPTPRNRPAPTYAARCRAVCEAMGLQFVHCFAASETGFVAKNPEGFSVDVHHVTTEAVWSLIASEKALRDCLTLEIEWRAVPTHFSQDEIDAVRAKHNVPDDLCIEDHITNLRRAALNTGATNG